MSAVNPLSSSASAHIQKVKPMPTAQELEDQKVEFDQNYQGSELAKEHDKSKKTPAPSADPQNTQELWADVGKGMNNLIFQDSKRVNDKFQQNMRNLWTEENTSRKSK